MINQYKSHVRTSDASKHGASTNMDPEREPQSIRNQQKSKLKQSMTFRRKNGFGPEGPYAQERHIISKITVLHLKITYQEEIQTDEIQTGGRDTYTNTPRAPSGHVRIYWTKGQTGQGVQMPSPWAAPELDTAMIFRSISRHHLVPTISVTCLDFDVFWILF